MVEWTQLAPGIAGIVIGIGGLIYVRVRLNERRRAAAARERRGS